MNTEYEEKQYAIDVTDGACMVVADDEQQAREWVLKNCHEEIEVTKLEEMILSPIARSLLDGGEKTPFFIKSYKTTSSGRGQS